MCNRQRNSIHRSRNVRPLLHRRFPPYVTPLPITGQDTILRSFSPRHAGYSYSGPTAAWAYKSIDTTGMYVSFMSTTPGNSQYVVRRRVFIIGPSHHVYLDGCALSICDTYRTPIGDLPLDRESEIRHKSSTFYPFTHLNIAIEELRASEEFGEMDIRTDEDEHSIEMHLPYVRKIFQG
jgi:hypothetical protein